MGIYRKGGNWFIDYRAYGRRIREKIGESRKLADSVLAKRKSEIAEKRFLDVRKVSRETFRDFSARYLEWIEGRIRTVDDDRQRVRQLLPSFGNLQLAEIDIAQAEKYMTRRLREPISHPFRGKTENALASLPPDQREAKLKAWAAKNTRTVSKATINREIACARF